MQNPPKTFYRIVHPLVLFVKYIIIKINSIHQITIFPNY